MKTAKRLVFDTSVYIADIEGGVFSPAYRTVQERLPRTHLASVVAAELLAGATNRVARRAVVDFIQWAHRVRRVVTPTPGRGSVGANSSVPSAGRSPSYGPRSRPYGMTC